MKESITPLLFLGVMWEKAFETEARHAESEIATKHFRSSPGNWQVIIDRVEEIQKRGRVLVRFSPDTILRAVSPAYSSLFFELVSALRKSNHLILVHRDLLAGDLLWLENGVYGYRLKEEGAVEDIHDPYLELGEDLIETEFQQVVPPSGVERILLGVEMNLRAEQLGIKERDGELRANLRSVIDYIRSSDLLILPYDDPNQVVSMAIGFINGTLVEENTIRMFISAKLIARTELERFIDLVRNYCLQIGLSDVNTSRVDTELGSHIVFKVDPSENSLVRIEDILQEFNRFFSLCITDKNQAKDALVGAGVSFDLAEKLTNEVARDGARLLLDLDLMRKKGMLDIEYKAKEDLLLNGSSNDRSHSPLTVVPQSVTIGTVNLISQVGCVIKQQEINVGLTEKSLRDFIDANSTEIERAALGSDLAAMVDKEIQISEKLSAYARLKRFVSRHAGKVEDLAIKGFIAWLESKMGSS